MLSALFDPLSRLKRRIDRSKSSGRIPPEFISMYDVPIPDAHTPFSSLEFIALDFETTGLDFNSDKVLSCGGITLDRHGIDFQTAFHHILKTDAAINRDSAVINMITPEQLLQGEDPQQIYTELAHRLAGRILITHCAVIEYTFLKKCFNLSQDLELPMIFLDTLNIERSMVKASGREGEFSLNRIRERRGFPQYEAHNALWDSIATAELFMAQLKDLFGKKEPKLCELYQRSH